MTEREKIELVKRFRALPDKQRRAFYYMVMGAAFIAEKSA